MKIKDIAGQRFGRLVVIEISKEKKYRITKFRCSSMAEHSAVNRVVIGSSPIS